MAMISLSIIFLVLLAVVLVLVVVSISKRHSDKNENFSGNIRLIYMFAVTIISLFLSIGGAIFAWNNAVKLILPEPSIHQTLNQELERHNQRNRAMRGLFTSLAAVAVGVPVFVYHGRKVKDKER
jgi:heme/copper-type cytochrome/quinol oxidase subunit 2